MYMAEPIDPNSPAGMQSMPMGPEGSPGGIGAAGAGQQMPKTFKLRQYDFIVQFCWQPQPRGKRIEMAQKKTAPTPNAETAPANAAAGSEVPASGPSS
jgi:hypothetical protein